MDGDDDALGRLPAPHGDCRCKVDAEGRWFVHPDDPCPVHQSTESAELTQAEAYLTGWIAGCLAKHWAVTPIRDAAGNYTNQTVARYEGHTFLISVEEQS